MPITIPNLDNRRFSDLVDEALAIIPRYAPEWTNHNPSDPGITLIELLAYVTEILLYRLNRVTRENRIQFLRLLQGAAPEKTQDSADPDTSVEEVKEALRQAVRDLQKPQRAVTAEDYERLIDDLKSGRHPIAQHVARVRCFRGKNLELPDDDSRSVDCPGHVSVVIVPKKEAAAQALPSTLAALHNELEPKRLLTTRLHVVPPVYVTIRLRALIGPYAGSDFKALQAALVDNLRQFFDPLPGGGTDEKGWSFGRAVYFSEVFARLEMNPAVDYVASILVTRLSTKGTTGEDSQAALGIQVGVTSTVGVNTRIGGESSGGAERLVRDSAGTLIAIALRPYELVRIDVHEEDLRVSAES